MRRDEVDEFHFICPFANVPSVINVGIVCKNRAMRMKPPPVSVADPSVQDIRRGVRVPGGGPLHSYANLYVHARNAMMSKLRHLNSTIAIIRVATDVLDLPDVVIADRNAAAGVARFYPAEEGLAVLRSEDVFRIWWTETTDMKQKRCAEVLVPDRVDPGFVLGAYVQSDVCKTGLAPTCPSSFSITRNADFYF